MAAARLLLLASLPGLLLAASEPPPPPTLTVTPSRSEYLVGDAVAALCSAPVSPALKIQAFQFWGTGGWALEARTSNGTYVHLFTVTGPRDAGTLGCTYTAATRARRTLRSRESRLVFINVKAPPPAPTLSGAVDAAAPALELACAAPPGASGRRFRFYRDGHEVRGRDGDREGQDGGREGQDGGPEGQDGGSRGGKLRLEGEAARGGNFSCAYEEEAADGRRVLSLSSQILPLHPPGLAPPSLLPLAAGCAVGGAAVLLALLLAVVMRRRKKGSARWEGLGDKEGFNMAATSGDAADA